MNLKCPYCRSRMGSWVMDTAERVTMPGIRRRRECLRCGRRYSTIELIEDLDAPKLLACGLCRAFRGPAVTSPKGFP